MIAGQFTRTRTGDPNSLTMRANEIDHRLGPIPGDIVDDIAHQLREAALRFLKLESENERLRAALEKAAQIAGDQPSTIGDCDQRGAACFDTGVVECAMENRFGVCVCSEILDALSLKAKRIRDLIARA